MVSATLLAAASMLVTVTGLAPSVTRIPVDEPAANTSLRAATARIGRRPPAPFRRSATQGIANARVNDPTQLPAAADITPAIAVNGSAVLIVWRVVGALPTQRLRAAYSVDGGASFTDAGWLPGLPGDWRWGVDPCVEVDPFDGTFMVGAQAADPVQGNTGIGFATAHIGTGLAWGVPSIIHATGYVGTFFGDQFHMKFDPTNFSLHMVFHDAYVPGAALIHRYSVDHGASWFAPDTIVSDPTGLSGTSPRVAYLGGRGPIVLHNSSPSWWTPDTAHSSAFLWPAFQPPVTVGAFRYEPGGLPGTVIDRVMNPAIAVDRTPFLYSNRVYAAWVAAAELSPWPAPAAGTRAETEPNGDAPTANGVGPSDGHITGGFASGSDADVFSVPMAVRQHLVIVPELIQSVGANANLRVEVLAADGAHTLGYTAVLATDVGAARLLFTAPRAATYFVRLTGFNVGNYQLALSYSNQSATPAMDRRDLMTSFSPDLGNSWSAPARVPVSLPGFEAGVVDIVVGNDGRPYLFWLDFSESDPDGAIATLRTTRSDDGGATWETPRTVSTAPSDWQSVTTGANSSRIGYRLDAATTPIPLGESPQSPPAASMQHNAAWSPAEDLHVTWVDARDGEGNIYAAHFPTGFEVLSVTNDTTAVPGQWLGLRMVLQNRNTLFPELVTPEFYACQRANWTSVYAPFTLDPATTSSLYPVLVQIPDTAAVGTVFYQAGIRVGTGAYGINTFIHVQAPSAVGDAATPLSFAPPTPNPASAAASFRFGLPVAADATLELFDVAGSRVRTLHSGRLTAGSHVRAWDLTDDAGRRVAPGVYLARLTVGDWHGTRRVAVIR